MVERLPQSEYLSLWEPVRQRVFAGRPDGTFIFPFTQETWEALPIPNHPTSRKSPVSWLNYAEPLRYSTNTLRCSVSSKTGERGR